MPDLSISPTSLNAPIRHVRPPDVGQSHARRSAPAATGLPLPLARSRPSRPLPPLAPWSKPVLVSNERSPPTSKVSSGMLALSTTRSTESCKFSSDSHGVMLIEIDALVGTRTGCLAQGLRNGLRPVVPQKSRNRDRQSGRRRCQVIDLLVEREGLEPRPLATVGRLQIADQPAGTYAKQILNRLLIDLAWNSSRLEGNTYSLLDTKRLIELGEEAAGRAHLEAQMILNNKDAIEFLVGNADEIGFSRYTILNLHAILANNLLADPTAAGRLRYIAVGIERSAFHPLELPQLIEASFDQLLATAAAINDPFEQAFFVMVQLPYLQPFDDVNKRVSRLAANIPLIKRNLAPLSFTDVPRQTYTEAMLGVYELNKIDLLKDVFMWAYERSAARYAAVRQSLGEPDPFRLRYREQLRELIAALVRMRVARKDIATRIAAWSKKEIDPGDSERFAEIVEAELIGLHEGNFARYRIRPPEFAAWRQAWKTR